VYFCSSFSQIRIHYLPYEFGLNRIRSVEPNKTLIGNNAHIQFTIHPCWQSENKHTFANITLQQKCTHNCKAFTSGHGGSSYALADASKAWFPLPEFTARELGRIFWHPSWRVSKNAPELTACQLGCIFWHPSTRASNFNSGVKKCTRIHGPSTRAVNSGSGNRA